jgi:hypothetical protein
MTTQPNTEPLKVGNEYFDATENLIVTIERVANGRVYYSGDADGDSTIDRFRQDFTLIGHPDVTEPSPAEVRSEGSVFLSNLHYFCAKTDGTYDWPKGFVGDLIKQAKREIEAQQSTTRVEGELTDEEIWTIVHSLDASDNRFWLDLARAIEKRALNQRLAVKEGEYIDGVNMDRLVSALSMMGVSFNESREALCAPSVMADHINRLTMAVMGLRERLSSQPVQDDQQAKDAALYKELLYCVGNKYPGESRHDTAKRYLLDREKFGVGEQPALSTTKQDG